MMHMGLNRQSNFMRPLYNLVFNLLYLKMDNIYHSLSQQDYDPLYFIKGVLAQHNRSKEVHNYPIQDQVGDTLRGINNLSFKMQMQGSESSNILSHSTQIIMNEITDLRQQKANQSIKALEETTNMIQTQSNRQEHREHVKNEFLQLQQTDSRINKCKLMCQEIEHFESRISKVEEYIRYNKFQELTLLIQQLQESLKVVRDISFFEKQKQRIERFDKLIMGYLQTKEKELVFESDIYKQNASDIKALVSLQQYFKRETQFIDQFISLKLVKEFEGILNHQQLEDSLPDSHKYYTQRFFPKFTSALIEFLSSSKGFLFQVFSDNQEHLQYIYQQLLAQIIRDYQEKLVNEFVNQVALDQQVEVYEQYFIAMLDKIQEIVPSRGVLSLKHNFYPLFKELYQALLEKYKRQVDLVMTESYEFIIEKDAMTEWGRNFEKVEYVVEKILVNNIEICQCFELASLTNGILRGLEKFIMQLCFHIGQFSNKKVHYAVPHPNNSSGVTGADDQQCMIYEQKFNWQNLFSYITLHQQLMTFFEHLKSIDSSLKLSLEKLVTLFENDTSQKKISAFIAQANTPYFKQLQRHLAPQTTCLLFTSDQTAQHLEKSVFTQELLNDAVKMNLLRTFVMPIFKELSNINLFSLWKQQLNSIPTNVKNTQKQLALLLPEPGEYIRKIGDHFISFIHKLDASQIALQCDKKLYLYHKYCSPSIDSSATFWIGEIGSFLCQTVSSKFMKINYLSADGERQLISDVLYLKKLVQQFCTLPSLVFENINSILVGLTVSKRQVSSKTLMELPETTETLKALLGQEGVDQLQVNELVVKAVQSKRRP